MIDKYNYNDEPSGRVDTLAMALDKCERLEKQLKIAVEEMSKITLAVNMPSRHDMFCIVQNALKQIKELEK